MEQQIGKGLSPQGDNDPLDLGEIAEAERFAWYVRWNITLGVGPYRDFKCCIRRCKVRSSELHS
jgi:hypothetical protein